MCKRPAAVDVAAQQDGRLDLERDRHVDDVAVAQVDLRRTAGALDHDDFEVVDQPVQRRAHDGPEPPLGAPRPGQGARLRVHAAHHHHLAPRGVRGRLQEDGVHPRLGHGARGERLDVLCAADLAPVRRHRGVVAHVLRLEWRHAVPAVGQRPTEAGGQEGLSRVRRAALHHQRLTHRRPPARGRCRPAPGSRASALNAYEPRLTRRTPRPPAIAAIGQPPLGEGASPWSRSAARSAAPRCGERAAM